jgi:nucleotide-binding universal stress UspA family protein
MYDDILIPYDGSEGAAEILHHASEIAHWADATVQVLYVADTTRDSVTVVEGQTVDVLEREGEDVVEEAGKTLETLGTPYETDVVQGNPAPTIVDYAERYDQDLIVMPTHGREGVSRYLIGSVSEKVVRLSSVPVLTARMEPDEQLVFPYEDVLIPIDGSAPATHAAQHGLSLAASMDATVHALSVVEEGLIDVDVGADGEDSGTDAAEGAIDDLVAEAEEDGVAETVRHVERGTPNEVIVDLVESNEIDAVVMGTTGRRGTDRILLGSVAEKTVRSAPVPVITARQPE